MSYTAKIKVVSDPNPSGEWITISYNEETLEKLHRSTSWLQTLELFKHLVPKDNSIVQINLNCTMELKEEYQMLKMG